MTTPDHRPYLVEGDLRTPEDVLAWLAAGLTPPDGPMRLIGAWHFRIELAARLDRERRRACRRAAREHFHMFAISARTFKHGSKACHEALCQALLGTRRHDGSLDTEPFSVWRTFADPLSAALAFRAAARAK